MEDALPESLRESVSYRFARLCAAQDAELTVALHSYGIDPSMYSLAATRAVPERNLLDEIFGSLNLPRRAALPEEKMLMEDDREDAALDVMSMPALLQAILDHPPMAPASNCLWGESEKCRSQPSSSPGVGGTQISAPKLSSELATKSRPPVCAHPGARLSRPNMVTSKASNDVVDVDALEGEVDNPNSAANLLKRDHAARQSRQGKRPRGNGHDSDVDLDARRSFRRRPRYRSLQRGDDVDSDSDDDDDRRRTGSDLDRTLRRNPYCAAFNAQQRESLAGEDSAPASSSVCGGFQSATAKLAADRRRAGKRPLLGDSRREKSGTDAGFDEREGDGNDVARTVTRAVLGANRRRSYPAPRPSGSAKRAKPDEEAVTRDDLPEIPNIEPRLVEMIMNEALDKSPGVDWDDIAGLQFAKKCVMEAVIWPMLRPDIFKGLRGPPKGLLLFGPPGTGKTVLAKTIASKCDGAKFFSISASSLMSKWVGEGEKMVRALFAVARELQPSIVFIDEIDSLLTQRTDGDQESSRRVKTEFLVQMDGAATSRDDRVLVIGATNRPAELDEAARRRMVKRLYIPLPDDDARAYLVKRLLLKQQHEMSEEDFATVVKLTGGYSGSDIYALCAEAALGPVRDLGASIGTIDVNNVRPISLADFQAAATSVRASVAQSDLTGYQEWNGQYGSFERRE